MNNPYLTLEEIKEAFRTAQLEESHNFLEEDIAKLANSFVMAAMPAIVRTERNLCIQFVASLNPDVAQALKDKRSHL